MFVVAGFCGAFIVGISVLGLSYAFDVVDLSSIGFNPQAIMSVVVLLYAKKDLQHLMKIWHIDVSMLANK